MARPSWPTVGTLVEAWPHMTQDVIDDLQTSADGTVNLTGDQTISGTKTFSGTSPSYGSNLAPALASWTLGGSASYSAPNITIGSGAGTISADIAVTAGTLYQIEITASPSTGEAITFALGATTDTCPSSLRAVALVAPSTGTLTLTISGASWSATISAITVRAVTRATPGVVAGVGELRAYSSNTAAGQGALYSNTTGYSNTAAGRSALYSPLGNSAYATTTASKQTAVGMESGQSSASQVDGITCVGYRATAGAANATALGYQARADHSGGVALGDNSTTTAANQVEIAGRHIEFVEMTAPAAGAADSARLFARDNGSGKTQLCVQFATGAVQVIATQP